MSLLKRLVIAATCVLTSVSGNAADLHLEVSDIEIMKGEVLVVLFDSEKAYSSSGIPLQSAKLPANSAILATTFTGLKLGDYAIKLFHDENSNGELDTNLIGMPSEGYGFSNNAGRYGPASYEEAKFSITENTSISIKLR